MSPVIIRTIQLPEESPWSQIPANALGLIWDVQASTLEQMASQPTADALIVAGPTWPAALAPLRERVPMLMIAADGSAHDSAGRPLPVDPPVEVVASVIDTWHAQRKIQGLARYGEEFLGEVLGMILRDGPEQLAGMQTAVQRGDRAELAKLAHKFRSSAGNFGLRIAYLLATRLEAAAATDPPLAARLTEALGVAFERMRPTLEAARP
jgi:HPt (histidine-containing phosphotransfer) domain-containing protein